MSVSELIEQHTIDGVFTWDIISVLSSLRPNIHYGIEIRAGFYNVVDYPEQEEIEHEEYKIPPTHEQIKLEWERQKAIAETLSYIKHRIVIDGYIAP